MNETMAKHAYKDTICLLARLDVTHTQFSRPDPDRRLGFEQQRIDEGSAPDGKRVETCRKS